MLCYIWIDDLVGGAVDLELSIAANGEAVIRNMSKPRVVEQVVYVRGLYSSRVEFGDPYTSTYGVFVLHNKNALEMSVLP